MLENILIQGSRQACEHRLLLLLLGSAGAAGVRPGLALVAALLAQIRVGQVPHRAHRHLAGTAAGLGCNWAEERSQVAHVGAGAGTTSHAAVHAGAAEALGADCRGRARLGVGQLALGAAWALHESNLGVVGRALGGLDDELAIGRLVDYAALRVQVTGSSLGCWGTTAGSHWYYNYRK